MPRYIAGGVMRGWWAGPHWPWLSNRSRLDGYVPHLSFYYDAFAGQLIGACLALFLERCQAWLPAKPIYREQ